MPKLTRLRTLLAKMQPTSGVDSVPTGAANAILCRNLDVSPIEGGTVARDLIRGFFGNSEQLTVAVFSKITFEVELAGSGTAGTAPAYGPLLRACAFSETILAAPVTGAAVAGSTTTTIVLAATASAVNDAYIGMPITIASGLGSGQTRTVIDYIGSTRTAIVDSAWTITPDITSNYSITANVTYGRVSAGFEMNTMYVNVDGILHPALDCRGNVMPSIAADGIPVLRFEMTALYVAPTDTVTPTVVLSPWRQPLVVNQVNTPVARLHGQSVAFESLSLNVGNSVEFDSLPGSPEQTLITDSKPSGDIKFEVDNLSVKNYFTVVRNATLGSLVLEHGVTAGNKVRITLPSVQLSELKYGDRKGKMMYNANITPLPIAGNDDIFICAF